MKQQIIENAIRRVESFPEALLKSLEHLRPKKTYEKAHAFPVSLPDRFRAADVDIIDWNHAAGMQNPLRLYVHIPWCLSKCIFCFYESDLGIPDESKADAYLSAIGKELELYSRRLGRDKVKTEVLYIGGGTPSILTPGQIDSLFSILREHIVFEPDAFLIAECSPGTLTWDKVSAFRENGINRVSLGVQCLDDRVLRLCRRDHDSVKAKRAYQLIRDAGMPEVNFDLMLALPGQTYESFGQTLEEALQLSPSSISFLDLRVCPGASLSRNAAQFSMPTWKDDITMRAIYQEMMDGTDYEGTRPHYYARRDEMRHRGTRCPGCDSRVDGFQIGVGRSAYSHIRSDIVINASPDRYMTALQHERLPIEKALSMTEADRIAMRAIRTLMDTKKLPGTEGVMRQYSRAIGFMQAHGLLTKNLELTRDGCLFGEEIVYLLYP